MQVIDFAEAGEFRFFAGPIGSDPFADFRPMKQVHQALKIFLLRFGAFGLFPALELGFGFFIFHESVPTFPG